MDEHEYLRSHPKWLVAAVAGAVVLPILVVLHELGHVVSAKVLGFEPVAMHYDGALTGVPPDGAPVWIRIFPHAAGQLVSLILALITAASVWMFRATSVALAVVLSESVRSLFMLGTHIRDTVQHSSSNFLVAFDELGGFAPAFGNPPISGFILSILGVVFPCLALLYVLGKFPSGRSRLKMLSATTMGIVVGYAIYFGAIGPWLLPVRLP